MNHPNTFDPNRKWVRVADIRANGLISFEFSVGEPEIFVELIVNRTVKLSQMTE